jgi:ATP-dependent Clp protease ATP-binding subunit ClpX
LPHRRCSSATSASRSATTSSPTTTASTGKKTLGFKADLLRFNDDALEAIAESALERKIRARGLRMIIEEPVLDWMYSLPHQKKLRACVITRDIVEAKDKLLSLLETAGEERG